MTLNIRQNNNNINFGRQYHDMHVCQSPELTPVQPPNMEALRWGWSGGGGGVMLGLRGSEEVCEIDPI